jgi:hypothetical protein
MFICFFELERLGFLCILPRLGREDPASGIFIGDDD